MRRTVRFTIWPSERLAAQSARWSFVKRDGYEFSLTAATDLIVDLASQGCEISVFPDLELPLVRGVYVCAIEQDGDVIRITIDEYNHDGPDDDGDDDPPPGGKARVEGIVARLEIDGRVSKLIIEHGKLIRRDPSNLITPEIDKVIKIETADKLYELYLSGEGAGLNTSPSSRFHAPHHDVSAHSKKCLQSAVLSSLSVPPETSAGIRYGDILHLTEGAMPTSAMLASTIRVDAGALHRLLAIRASAACASRILH